MVLALFGCHCTSLVLGCCHDCFHYFVVFSLFVKPLSPYGREVSRAYTNDGVGEYPHKHHRAHSTLLNKDFMSEKVYVTRYL